LNDTSEVGLWLSQSLVGGTRLVKYRHGWWVVENDIAANFPKARGSELNFFPPHLSSPGPASTFEVMDYDLKNHFTVPAGL